MMRRTVRRATAMAVALLLAPAAAVAAAEVAGRIEHIDPGSRTLHFQDGRIVTLGPDATIRVDGRELPVETLRRGMNVVVQDSPGPAAATARPAHPPVSASGTVATVDSASGVITFQDGRSLRLGRAGRIWEPSRIADVRPGEQVLVQNAEPAGYRGAAGMTPERMRMGRVIQVDPARSMVLLDDGTWVRTSPRTRLRLNGQAAEAQTLIAPGDEVLVVVGQPAAAAESPAASDQAPSAMPREGLAERGDFLQADEVHIFRRHQSP